MSESSLKEVKTKQVECIKCGWVGGVTKFIPLRLAWCGGCGASGWYLRLLKPAARVKSKLIRETVNDKHFIDSVDYDSCRPSGGGISRGEKEVGNNATLL